LHERVVIAAMVSLSVSSGARSGRCGHQTWCRGIKRCCCITEVREGARSAWESDVRAVGIQRNLLSGRLPNHCYIAIAWCVFISSCDVVLIILLLVLQRRASASWCGALFIGFCRKIKSFSAHAIFWTFRTAMFSS